MSLIWNPEYTCSDIIQLGMLIMSFLAICQWRTTLKQKRADYLQILLERIKSYKKVFQKIDYGEEWYNPNFHNNDDLEKQIDNLFEYLSYVCYLRKSKLINEEDFNFMSYYVKRVLKNRDTINYLHNLYCFSKRQSIEFIFSDLLDFAIKENFIDDEEDFRNPQSKKYPKYLNF